VECKFKYGTEINFQTQVLLELSGM